ncbi:MAG: M3 family metallopeptidase, partial [Cyclobacteriaceae bacterium]|nr:M3 family metallopeptidase [Cyclobacteriaceae bacterium]
MNNPFLSPFHTPFDVPPFTQIETIHYLPALKEAIGKAHAEIAKITGNHEPPTFENTIETLEECGEAVGRIASVLFNLNSAETNDALQQVAQEASPLLTQFDNDIKQNKRLFERVSFVHMQLDFLSLTTEQKTLLEKTYKSFVRSGAGLSEEAKKRYSEIDTELARLTLTFGENVLAETNHFELVIEDKAQLSGLPEDVVRRASELATEKGKEGSWVFTLQAPSYVPFMEYADNRALREQMFKAYMTKAFKGDKYDNQQLAKDIAALRAEKAALLGYESYAAFILEERMALSPANVENFLLDLLEKARPKAVEEVEEIKEFMRSLGATHALERWDWSYYSEKLRKKKFDLDDELIKPYFQLENVIEGVFATAGRLYGITFVPNDQIPVYHPDVAAYEVKNEAGETIALFLTDFFPRKGKRPGAWMTAYRDQKKIKGVHQVPIISIV